MAESSALEMNEIIPLALNKHFMVNSSYGSKTNFVTLILQEKKEERNKERNKNHLCPESVSRDKQGKKRCSKIQSCYLLLKNERTSHITRRTRNINITEGVRKNKISESKKCSKEKQH